MYLKVIFQETLIYILMKTFTEKELKEIFFLIYDKVRSIQINNSFDKALKRVANNIYIGKSDDFCFNQLCDLTFQAGLRGEIWLRFEPEIRKEFSNYKPDKVANYNQKDVERMLSNPKMIKNRKKIDACVHNAKKIVSMSKEYGSFWRWLANHTTEELVEKLRSNFKWMGYTNAYASLLYCGMDVMKTDLNVRRVLFRLGLLDSEVSTPKTYKQIQTIGRKMAEAVSVKVAVIDYVLYMYGAGEKPFVKYAICGKVPKCDECPLTSFCDFYQGK